MMILFFLEIKKFFRTRGAGISIAVVMLCMLLNSVNNAGMLNKYKKWIKPAGGEDTTKYENELLILTPVAVKTELQRQHISRDLIEYGFVKAKELGFTAVLVEGNPKNYNSRGFQSSYKFGIEAGPNIKLPHPDCLMIKELKDGALTRMSCIVDYYFYQTLHEG